MDAQCNWLERISPQIEKESVVGSCFLLQPAWYGNLGRLLKDLFILDVYEISV